MHNTSKEQILKQKSDLSPTKLALLERRLRGKNLSGDENKLTTDEFSQITVDPSQRYQPFPLTDVQQAYWIGRNSAFELGNVSTHGYLEVDTIDLDLNRFENAWQKIVERHGMLRTIILPNGQQQILERVPPYKIKVLDLRTHSPEQVETQLLNLREQLSHQVLSVDQYPLFEVQAARLDGNRIRLYLSFEILIGDGRSWTIVSRELAQLMQTPEYPLPPLELSFRDYVLKKISLKSSESYSRSLTYWQDRLLTLPPSPELPIAKQPAQIKHPQFARRSGHLDNDAWNHLKQRAKSIGLTPSGLLLSAFAEVLTVWSKNPKFTINLTLFNRLPLHPQVNQIVGDFTSLTLLAIDNSGQDSFTNRARRIQKQLWQDLDHKDVGGVYVLRELAHMQKNSSKAFMPVVFTSALISERVTNDATKAKALTMGWLGEHVYNITQTAQVYLDHQIAELDEGLFYIWDAVEEVFPPALLDEMFSSYNLFLQQLAVSEDLWKVPIRNLSKSAQQQAIINATNVSFSKNVLLHTLFFEKAETFPNHTAIATSQRILTYQEVSERAAYIAQYLYQQGVQPNQLVAIVMEKGWEQVVAALGILASGAAYVPIDPKLPTERQHYLLKETKVQWVLTQSRLDNTLNWPETVKRLSIDDSLPQIASKVQCVQSTSDLAYVIYTSGSTGLPKGVMIDHQGAVNTILDINQRFKITSSDRIFALSSLSFDLSVFDIFGTLAAGGTIVIPDPDEIKNPAHWTELMVQQQVTVWNSVPALMQMLVEYSVGFTSLFPQSLRLALMSGDWIPLSLPDQIRSLCQNIKLVSLGGATEASIWSIFYPIDQVDPNWKSIPYGRPMANQKIYVLNETLEACPTWVTGQLYIGGIGIAKGYWQDDNKTKASFITHPQTQEKLYKTGDLGRCLPDGTIEFLGREDFQVKINGHRIELGEIESVLSSHPAIETALVLAKDVDEKSKQLIAYIICQEENTPLENQRRLFVDSIQEFLRKKLPEYMVPPAFCLLDKFPLTPNGKIDRKALPAADIVPTSKAKSVSPTTETEHTLADILKQVLQIEKVGIYDNFFDLGGNSIQIVQIHNKIKEVFKKDIPITEIFRHPTINDLDKYFSENTSNFRSNYKQLSRAESRKEKLKKRRRRTL
ncbi:amino acid adenylation domain-containing protein [Leptothoe sp. LEGE 181152]|nr:amino acid adenylation domain-containing protein [Leptothoe sp. LEGE 181152]